MKTLNPYIEEGHENRGWKRIVGTILAFVGFTILTNATLCILAFGYLISKNVDLIIAIMGAIIGSIGMVLRGYKNKKIFASVQGALGVIITGLLIGLIESYFGFVGVIVFGVVIALAVTKLNSRVDYD